MPEVIGSLRCEHPTKTGAPCRTRPVNGSKFCFTHDPALDEVRTAARRRGGEHKHLAVLPPDSPELSLRSGRDVTALAERAINLVLRGEIDPKVANSVCGLLSIFVRAQETMVHEERFVKLEAAVKMKQQPRPDLQEGTDKVECKENAR